MLGRRRAFASFGLACALATSGCTSRFEVMPTTASDVRAASREVAAGGTGHVRGRDDGKTYDVDGYAQVHAEHGFDGSLGTIAERCARGPCPTDDPHATQWTVTVEHRRLDVEALVGYSLLAGFIGLNVGCFVADACATPVKTTVGVTDAVIGVGAVALLVTLAVAFRHFRGD